MDRIRISKRTVDQAESKAKAYRIWDQDLTGFGVRIQPSGVKTYFIEYREGTGRNATKRQFTLGRHGVVAPDQAREEAQKLLAGVRLGEDPQGKRLREREMLTVQELCAEYLENAVTTKKASTLQSDRYRVQGHVIPLIGSKRIDKVTRADIEQMRDDIALGRTAKRPSKRKRTDSMAIGGKGTATRTIGMLGGIFNYAVRRGYIAESPVSGVKRFKDRRCDRFLTVKELRRLAEAIEASQESLYAKTIIRILLLTGARKGEIEQLKWREVDFDGGYLRLEDSKTGQKVIPVVPQVLELLHKVPHIEGESYVFPSLKKAGRYYTGVSTAWKSIRVDAALPDLRLHDLRHTFASLAVNKGASLPMIGKLLGHRDSQTTERYAHLQADPLRDVARAVALDIPLGL